MLSLTIIAVGGLKERYLADACGEYIKRLGAYCRPSVLEVPECRLPRNASPAQIKQGIEAEGEAILAKLPKGAHLIALCVEGAQYSSEELASELDALSARTSHVVFAIGGSHGLADAVKKAAGHRLSMSRMTFPHQLARVMLLEQLYRALSINAGAKYHK